MLLALKANREVKIDEAEKQGFIEQGFKIVEIEKDGKQKVLHDPKQTGDAKLEAEVEALKEENAKLKADLKDKEAQVKEIQAELKKVAKKK